MQRPAPDASSEFSVAFRNDLLDGVSAKVDPGFDGRIEFRSDRATACKHLAASRLTVLDRQRLATKGVLEFLQE